MMGVGGWGKSFPVLCRKCHSRPKRLSPTRVCNIKISIVLINRKGRGGGGHFKIQGQEGMGDKKKGTLLSSLSFSCPFLPPRKRGGGHREAGGEERKTFFFCISRRRVVAPPPPLRLPHRQTPDYEECTTLYEWRRERRMRSTQACRVHGKGERGNKHGGNKKSLLFFTEFF